MNNNLYKKLTKEDKFSRKWWSSKRAKRIWVRFIKRKNRRKFRRIANKGELI